MINEKLKSKLHSIVFEADTKAGKIFDEILIAMILLSLSVVIIDSIPNQSNNIEILLQSLEWFFTIIFTLEYFLRIYLTDKPLKYIFSFYGIIDFISIIPTYIGILLPQTFALTSIRMIRLVRIFRILKLVRFLGASNIIGLSLYRSRYKIGVFFLVVFIIVIIMGSLIYMIEGPERGFDSIPKSIYWAIVTITTVGYGDIAPQTPLGQFLASIIMLTGYAIIAVPTGIITSELSTRSIKTNTQVCKNCHCESHDDNALYCKKCGNNLEANKGDYQS